MVNIRLINIIRWEQLTHRAFTTMDYESEDDMVALLYTLSQEYMTLEEYRDTLNNVKMLKSRIREVRRALDIQAQYEAVTSSDKKSEDSCDGEVKEECIGTMAFMLIACGIDAHYVLNELELQDLPLLANAIQRRRRDEMETRRLFAYMQMLPHIDTSKLANGMRDIIRFDWEKGSELKADHTYTEEEYDEIIRKLKNK